MGGGIAIIYRDTLNQTQTSMYNFQSMECSDFSLDLPSHCVNLAIIYRPPDRSFQQFLNDLYDYMERNINTTGKLLLTGDFNIKMNDDQNQETAIFLDLLESFGLINHVHSKTHCQENTLDLIISSEQYHLVQNPNKGHLFSDHNFVYYNLLAYGKPQHNTKVVTYHKLKAISPTDFGSDITQALVKVDLHNLQLSSCLMLYNILPSDIMDKHAPEKTKEVSNRRKIPWFNDEVSKAIRSRRKAECKWLLDKNNPDKFLAFYRTQRTTTNILNQAEKNYYCKLVENNHMNTKRIFTIGDNLLDRNQDLPLPPGFLNEELAECFNNFFISKIVKIRDILATNHAELPLLPVSHHRVGPYMDIFRVLSEDEVSLLVRKSPTKSCKANPIPAVLLKKILPDIAPLLIAVVNKSLQTGIFPDDLKGSIGETPAEENQS